VHNKVLTETEMSSSLLQI